MPVYRDKPGTTTEWEDIQYKFGNKVGKYVHHESEILASKAAAIGDETFDVAPNAFDEQSTRALERAVEDDDEDEDILAELRRRRMEQLKCAAAEPRFGNVRRITRGEYVAEVTNAPRGTPVILLLFEEGHTGCGAVLKATAALATKFPKVKFLFIKSTEAISGFPAQQLPAVLLYYNGNMRRQVTGVNTLGGTDATPDKAEALLAMFGFLPGSEFTPKGLPPLSALDDEEKATPQGRRAEDDDEESEDD